MAAVEAALECRIPVRTHSSILGSDGGVERLSYTDYFLERCPPRSHFFAFTLAEGSPGEGRT